MSRKRIKPELTDEKMGGNPLTDADFKIIVRKKTIKVTDKDGNKGVADIELEYEKFTKLFTGSDKRKVLSQLSAPAKGLFLWLIYELESGKDYLWVNRERFMEETNINSVNTYKSGVAELVKKKLIAASLIKDVFWINPRLFFCGSRINKYPDNVEVYVPKKEKDGE